MPFCQGLGQFGICSVPRLDRNDMAEKSAACQKEVPDDVENFVAYELVGIPQRLLSHYRFASHDNRILKASATYQSFVQKLFNILVKNKGARPGDFFLINLRSNLRGIELGESPTRTNLGTGDTEFPVRHNGQQ